VKKLFRVERTSRRMNRLRRATGYIDFYDYAVLAEDAESAKTIAQARYPRDELDGPTVEWAVEEDEEGILMFRTGWRRA
jgi:hypothetical protein